MDMTNRELLENRLATDFELLDNAEGEERAKLIEDISALYKLKIEEDKNDLDYDDRYNKRLQEKERLDKECEFKKQELELKSKEEKERLDKECEFKKQELELKSKEEKNRTRVGLITAGVTAGIALMGNLFYSFWYHKGLKFEETGTVATHQTKNLESKMVPRR